MLFQTKWLIMLINLIYLSQTNNRNSKPSDDATLTRTQLQKHSNENRLHKY